MDASIQTMIKKRNLEYIKYKNLELIKKIVSIDYGLMILFYGKYNSQECLILEIQNIDTHILNPLIIEYLNINDLISLKKIGLSYDDVKGTLYIVYDYKSSEQKLIKDYIENIPAIERLQVFIEILEIVKSHHSKYNHSVYLLFSWNIIINQKQEIQLLEPHIVYLIEKIYAQVENERRRHDIKSVAPEYFKNSGYELKSDIWILGNLLFEFMCNLNRNIYSCFKISENEIKKKLCDLKFKFNFKEFSNDQNLVNILDLCFRVDFKQRISINDLISLCNKLMREWIKSNQCQSCNKLIVAKIHCSDCIMNICTKCFDSHSNHNHINIQNILSQFEDYKQSIKSKITELNNSMNDLNFETKNAFLQKQKVNLNILRSDQEKIIKKNTQMLKDLIDEMEKDQIELMNSVYSKFLRKINDFQSDSSKKQSEIKKKIAQNRKDCEIDNSNIEIALKNINSFQNLLGSCDKLTIEINELKENIESNLIMWDQQFLSKLEYTKSVCDNLTSNILENITFVKFNSLLKCGNNHEYIINDELILKYLEDNFFFLKKYLPNLSSFLANLTSELDNSSYNRLKDFISNKMIKGKKEILVKINDEFERQFDKLIEFNLSELKLLITKEKINLTTSSSAAALNLILNIEKEIETRIIDNVKRYIISNKKSILKKLSLILTQDLLIQVFTDVFETHFNSENNNSSKTNIIELNKLNMGNKGFKIVSELIKQFSSIGTLSLKENGIGNKGCPDLCEIIKKANKIENLILNSNRIQLEGIISISTTIKGISLNNSHLVKLSLYDNDLRSEGVGVLSENLTNVSTLVSLDLGKTNMHDEGLKNLCNLLKGNKSIENLSLSNNSISDEGIEIFSAILNLTSLTDLNLQLNMISFKGVKFFSQALKKNNTLLNLDLASNYIGDFGAKYLSETVMINKTLKQINLIDNSITNEGAKSITDALKNNSVITKIKMNQNKLSEKNHMFDTHREVISIDHSHISAIEEKDSIQYRDGDDLNDDYDSVKVISEYEDKLENSKSIYIVNKARPKKKESILQENYKNNLKDFSQYDDKLDISNSDNDNKLDKTKSNYDDQLNKTYKTKSIYEDKFDKTYKTKSIYDDKIDITHSVYDDRYDKTVNDDNFKTNKSMNDDKNNKSQKIYEDKLEITTSPYKLDKTNKSKSIYLEKYDKISINENNLDRTRKSKSYYDEHLMDEEFDNYEKSEQEILNPNKKSMENILDGSENIDKFEMTNSYIYDAKSEKDN